MDTSGCIIGLSGCNMGANSGCVIYTSCHNMGTSGYSIGLSGCNTGTQYWGMSRSDYSMSTFVSGCGMGISACNMVTSDSSIDTSHSDTGTVKL